MPGFSFLPCSKMKRSNKNSKWSRVLWGVEKGSRMKRRLETTGTIQRNSICDHSCHLYIFFLLTYLDGLNNEDGLTDGEKH